MVPHTFVSLFYIQWFHIPLISIFYILWFHIPLVSIFYILWFHIPLISIFYILWFHIPLYLYSIYYGSTYLCISILYTMVPHTFDIYILYTMVPHTFVSIFYILWFHIPLYLYSIYNGSTYL